MKQKPTKPKLVDKEKMLKIKEVIEQYCKDSRLREPLPSLPVLADIVSLTETVMKAQFKLFFGTGVYEYYLRRKMYMAGKKMIDHPNISVGELAKHLGYIKTNNFITIFKRFYKCTPGAINRSEIPSILKKLS